MSDTVDPTVAKLVEAALPHVAFDGWSETTFRAAVADSGVDPAVARGLAPKGATDLAMAYHRMGDAAMLAAIRATDMEGLKFREKVARAVRLRIEAIDDREAVRRGVTLFALPQNAALGAQAVWDTVDLIWTALGDTSDDLNWYTKRATLAGVYSATVLYWLGDDSAGHEETWGFLDRRIEDVMQIEKVKAGVAKLPGAKLAMAGPNWLASKMRAPGVAAPNMPGIWPRRDDSPAP